MSAYAATGPYRIGGHPYDGCAPGWVDDTRGFIPDVYAPPLTDEERAELSREAAAGFLARLLLPTERT